MMLAVERLSASPDAEVKRRISNELASVESRLIEVRNDGRARALADRLGLHADDLELMWTAVACSAEPRVMPHLVVLGGMEGRRGLTLATYLVIADLDEARAAALTQRWLTGHPLLREHVLERVGEGLVAAATPMCAPERTVAWLTGDDALDEALGGAGCIVPPVDEPALDARQRAAAHGLPALLGGFPTPGTIRTLSNSSH